MRGRWEDVYGVDQPLNRKDSRTHYQFSRAYRANTESGLGVETFTRSNGVVPVGTTYSATYTYSEVRNGKTVPDALPDTGAGGIAGGGLPVGGIAGIVSISWLLWAGGYAVLRRR